MTTAQYQARESIMLAVASVACLALAVLMIFAGE